MIIREAQITDIPAIQKVRNSVRENTLSDPNLVTDKDCENYITIKGKGWVCELEGKVVGFAIADITDNNIWALFMDPIYEKKGIGRLLHDTMVDWYFNQTSASLWLGTAPGTRAEKFYRKAGWIETGLHGKGEIKFEMSFKDWTRIRSTQSSV
jgi:GNAT superfamily N-acetyltransferase